MTNLATKWVKSNMVEEDSSGELSVHEIFKMLVVVETKKDSVYI